MKLFNGLQRLILLLFFALKGGAGRGIPLNLRNVHPLPNWNLQKYSIHHSDERQVGTTKEFLCAPNEHLDIVLEEEDLHFKFNPEYQSLRQPCELRLFEIS